MFTIETLGGSTRGIQTKNKIADLGHHLDCLEDVDYVVDPPPLRGHLLGQVVQRDLAPLRGRDLSREAGYELVAQQSQGLVLSGYLREKEEFVHVRTL